MIVYFSHIFGYIEISERSEEYLTRVRFYHKLCPHVLTHGIIVWVNYYTYVVCYNATVGLANKRWFKLWTE